MVRVLTASEARSSANENTVPASREMTPCAFADWIGHEYATGKSDDHRKAFGLYLTPEPVARFMARGIKTDKSELRLLDPAAGGGILICAVVEELVGRGGLHSVSIVAHEIDDDLAERLEQVLTHLKKWAAGSDVRVKFEVKRGDFVLSECLSLGMLESVADSKRFDLVIGNPPYFKIGKLDARASAASEIVYGQPNIYGVFMAVSAALLRNGGEFVFITPRSFASGPYFKRLREWLFARVRPVGIHVFGSRSDAFGRDEVLQENVIFHGVRDDSWEKHIGRAVVAVSTSHGLRDLDHPIVTQRRASELIAGEGRILRIPASVEEEQALRKVESWKGSLKSYGMQISTGPVVAFRSTGWMRKEESGDTVPLVWLNHVFPLEVHWPNGVRKPQYISAEAASEKLLLPCRNYVVMRRFSAKEDARRLTAAPLLAEGQSWKMVGLENHLNYIYRPDSTLSEDEAWGLAALYSSSLLDAYFRCVNGNTQVSATELRVMPLPELATICELGRRVRKSKEPLRVIDGLLKEIIGA